MPWPPLDMNVPDPFARGARGAAGAPGAAGADGNDGRFITLTAGVTLLRGEAVRLDTSTGKVVKLGSSTSALFLGIVESPIAANGEQVTVQIAGVFSGVTTASGVTRGDLLTGAGVAGQVDSFTDTHSHGLTGPTDAGDAHTHSASSVAHGETPQSVAGPSHTHDVSGTTSNPSGQFAAAIQLHSHSFSEGTSSESSHTHPGNTLGMGGASAAANVGDANHHHNATTDPPTSTVSVATAPHVHSVTGSVDAGTSHNHTVAGTTGTPGQAGSQAATGSHTHTWSDTSTTPSANQNVAPTNHTHAITVVNESTHTHDLTGASVDAGVAGIGKVCGMALTSAGAGGTFDMLIFRA